MHSFKRSDGTAVRLIYADEAAAAIRRDPVAKHLAGDLDAANQSLERAWVERLGAERQRRRARAELRVQHVHLDKALGDVMRLIVIESGGSDSALGRELFPEGTEGAKAFTAPKQLALAVGVQGRLTDSENEGAEAVRRAGMARFEAEVDAFALTVEVLESAKAEEQRLRKVEEEVREDHARTLAATAGQLHALFPRDLKRRRAFDPPVKRRKRSRADEDALDADDAEDEDLLDPPASAAKPAA